MWIETLFIWDNGTTFLTAGEVSPDGQVEQITLATDGELVPRTDRNRGLFVAASEALLKRAKREGGQSERTL